MPFHPQLQEFTWSGVTYFGNQSVLTLRGAYNCYCSGSDVYGELLTVIVLYDDSSIFYVYEKNALFFFFAQCLFMMMPETTNDVNHQKYYLIEPNRFASKSVSHFLND